MRAPLPFTAALVTAAALCAGCASHDDAGDGSAAKSTAAKTAPADAVRAAVKATRATSAHTRQNVKISDGQGQTYRIDITGGFDLDADRGALSVRMPGGPTGRIDEVFADDTVYVRGTGDLAMDGWGSTSRSTAKAHAMLRAPLNDPEYVLEQISAMRQVTESGTETLDKVPATHYRGTLGHSALTLRTTSKIRDKADEARDYLGSDLPVFADAWIDGKGRIVRARTDLNLGGVRMTVTLSLSQHGKPVRVAVPDAGQTSPVPEFDGPMLG
ncbi:hypothetical protein [Streptomyces sp. NPDC058695]|uniref:hypothetical protein n=1 Tax=Streptomyces sp. NPDC058695 TaxID=3346604 RepID=UPI0036552C67